MTRIVGAVLAAGSGSRMGTPKAELNFGGTRLVDRAVSALRGGGCRPVIVVARAGVPVPEARLVVNEDPGRGMRSSLELAVDAAADDEQAVLAVLLVDTPGVTAESVRAVIESWSPGRIAVATYAGRRGHPIVMPVTMWRQALALAGPDEGARTFLQRERALVDEIATTGDPTDLDTPDDLARWLATRGQTSDRPG